MLCPMRAQPLIACVVGLVATACAPPVSSGGFDAPDPASRIYAIERAMRTDDVSKTPLIVEQLDSDDPAVRFLAIGALEKLTGETYGYHYDDPPYLREPAIQRWVAYVNETFPHDADG